MKRSKFIILLNILLLTAFLMNTNAQSKTRVGQTDLVNFPKKGEVKIEVIETIGKPAKINFSSKKSKKNLGSFTLSNGDRYIPFQFESAVNPITRFRVLENIEGLPTPLIQAVAVHPGGSDHSFWTILFAEINGKIKMLTPKTTENAIQGGVHIGSLGVGNGVGMAVYNFVWEDDEAHFDAHRYTVDLYKFDEAKRMFVKGKTVTSKEKYNKKTEALNELGFGFFENRLNDFPAIRDFRVDDSEFPQTETEFSYEAQKQFIPADLGKIYLGMPFDKFAKQLDLKKAEVSDTRFEWLELSIPLDKGSVENLVVRIHGLTLDEKKNLLKSEMVEKTDDFGDKYEDEIDRLIVDKIPAKGFVYSMYIKFKNEFDLKDYVLKTFGKDGEVRQADVEYHFFDIQWTKKTSDGLDWLIRSFHESDTRILQLLGRIDGTEWALDG